MKIILVDGTELTPIIVTGEKRNIQGASRDTLNFVFSADAGMDTLDAVFTSNNCESIKIVDDSDSEYIHKAYTIRADLNKKSVEITPATSDTAAVYEDRITVSMAQRTYTETRLAENTAALNVLLTGEVM